MYQSFSSFMLSWGYFLMRGIQVLISIVIPAYFVYNTIGECFEDIYIFSRLICMNGEIRNAQCSQFQRLTSDLHLLCFVVESAYTQEQHGESIFWN